MTFLFISILIIIYIIIITKNKTNRKLEKTKKAVVEKIKDVMRDDRAVLYNYLFSKLNRDYLRIEKQKEAMELEKKVKMAENNYEQLTNLKVEIEKFHDLTVSDLATSYFNTADEYAKKKSTHKQAIVFYNKAIDLVKEPKYYNNRGCLFHKMNCLEMAIDDYNQAIILKPNNGQAYYNRGGAYYTLGRKNDALRDLQIASEMGIEEAGKLLQFYF